MIAVCVFDPVCAVREARPWSQIVRCQRLRFDEWRCIVLQSNGHAFRFKVTRSYDAYQGVEYYGGWLKAERIHQ